MEEAILFNSESAVTRFRSVAFRILPLLSSRLKRFQREFEELESDAPEPSLLVGVISVVIP